MFHIMSTSRGKAIESHLETIASKHKLNYTINVDSGATLTSITQTIQNSFSNHSISSPCTICILAGLPDVTQMISIKSQHYQEVIYQGEPDEIRDTIMRKIHNIVDLVHSHSCKIVISPIVPSNIAKWNHTRLRQRKTLSLRHTHNYENMQRQIHSTVVSINKEIIELNNRMDMKTPFINKEVITSYRRRKTCITEYNYSYLHFPDGVHCDDKVGEIWAKKIVTAITGIKLVEPKKPKQDNNPDTNKSETQSQATTSHIPHQKSSTPKAPHSANHKLSSDSDSETPHTHKRSWRP